VKRLAQANVMVLLALGVGLRAACLSRAADRQFTPQSIAPKTRSEDPVKAHAPSLLATCHHQAVYIAKRAEVMHIESKCT
jgi:hypothetical protein